MEDPSEITVSSVTKFLEENGGRSANHELVSHFKKLLNHPTKKDVFRLKFKDIVNSIASVHEENGLKYICLKKQYFTHSIDEDSKFRSIENQPYPPSYQPYWRYRFSFNANLVPPPSQQISTSSHCASQEENRLLHTNVPEHNRRRSVNDVEVNRNDVRPQSRTRSHSLFTSEPNATVYPPINYLLNENNISDDLKLRESTTQSLPESSINYFMHKPVDNQRFVECSDNAYIKLKSPTRRPIPLCLSNENLDSLLGNESGTQDFLDNNSSIVPDATQDKIQSKNKIPDIHINSSSSEIVRAESSPVKKDSENFATPRTSDISASESTLAANPEVENNRSHSCSVRERAQIIDTIAAATTVTNNNLPRRTSSRASNTYRSEKTISEDNASIVSLDSKLKRQWFIKASKADYHGLVSLLKKEPRLAGLRDIASGFTALHWAAKHGNAEVVKLIAGTHKISPNLKSNGGYTCIHLATLYKHKAIVDLLLKTYGANPTIRDNSGKRADQYPENYVSFTVGITRKPPKPAAITAASPSSLDRIEIPANGKRILVRPVDELSSSNFIRIGSLNLKVSRSKGVFASVRGSSVRLKTWSSADCVNQTWLPESSERYSIPKKKKYKKKQIEYPTIESNVNKNQDSDSDSAYGFRP